MDYGSYAAISFQMPFEPEAYAGLSHDISWFEAQIGMVAYRQKGQNT